MNINQIFELSMVVDTDRFQKILTMVHRERGQLRETEEGYIDLLMAPKGITVIYRDSQYKKKIRLLVNSCLIVDDADDAEKLVRKLDKRIKEYFHHKYRMEDFTLLGMNFVADVDVGSRDYVAAYLKVLQRVGKVKRFSPVSFDFLDAVDNFCLSGNSNSIDFLFYDLGTAIVNQRRNADAGRISKQVWNTLRAEVRLTRPKAIRSYTDADGTSGQIVELTKDRQHIFLDTFARVIPFGDYHKKDAAMEIIQREVTDSIMRRRMLRLLVLIPEKKSLYLAQKAMDCRNVEKVIGAFAKINLSPVTISKRHGTKHLKNLYSYF